MPLAALGMGLSVVARMVTLVEAGRLILIVNPAVARIELAVAREGH